MKYEFKKTPIWQSFLFNLQILVPPSNGGRACPSVLQEKPCNVPCNNFQWQTNGWSNCDLDNTASEFGCGNGKKYRNVWLVN